MNVKPINDLVLIKPHIDPPSDIILMPDTHYEPESMGEVVAFGTGVASRRKVVERFTDDLIERLSRWHPLTPARQAMERDILAARDAYQPEHVCAVGDMVAFHPKDGQEIVIDGELYLMIREDDLLAVVEPVEVSA